MGFGGDGADQVHPGGCGHSNGEDSQQRNYPTWIITGGVMNTWAILAELSEVFQQVRISITVTQNISNGASTLIQIKVRPIISVTPFKTTPESILVSWRSKSGLTWCMNAHYTPCFEMGQSLSTT